MSKQRYVKDSFWTDSYISKMSPDHKLVFIYLLTNPLCNIAGVFEITSKRIAFETGYDVDVIENILKRFSHDKKIIRNNDWIVICNHVKHQALGNSTAEGINRVVKSSPEYISELFIEKTLTNSKNEEYNVLVLDDDYTPPIDPLYTPPIRAYSEVKYSKVISKEEQPKKETFGELGNVKMTTEEYEKLIVNFNQAFVDQMIFELDTYVGSTGKRYKSHYATILSWAKRKYDSNKKIKSNLAFS